MEGQSYRQPQSYSQLIPRCAGLREDEADTSWPGIAGTQPSNALWLALEEEDSQPAPPTGRTLKLNLGFTAVLHLPVLHFSESLRFSLFSVSHLIVSHGASLSHEIPRLIKYLTLQQVSRESMIP